VLDNGGAMKKNPYLIDFLVPTVKQAFKYGRQHGQVKIIRKGW
jgi:3D (Asp-Asp-Asp) domain-containing protein